MRIYLNNNEVPYKHLMIVINEMLDTEHQIYLKFDYGYSEFLQFAAYEFVYNGRLNAINIDYCENTYFLVASDDPDTAQFLETAVATVKERDKR